MKKILVLSNMYPSRKYPHYGIFVKNSVDILNTNDYEVETIVMTKSNSKQIRYLKYLCYMLKAFLTLIFRKYDYIYVHYISISGIPVIFASKFKKLNIISNIHGNDLVPENEKDERLLKNSRKLLIISEKIIVPSEYFFNELRKFDSCFCERAHIFPSGGVNLEEFYQTNSMKNENEDNSFKVGFVSRIEKDKGWDTFLEMMQLGDSILQNTTFFIVGSGNEEKEFNKIYKKMKMNNNVKKYSYMSHKEMNQLFNKLDVFVFPTYRKSDSLGLVGIESMATGTIVLAADNFGPKSYIKDSVNGFLFKPQDANEMLKKIIKIKKLSEIERRRIIDNGIITAKEYSTDTLTDKLIDLFQ